MKRMKMSWMAMLAVLAGTLTVAPVMAADAVVETNQNAEVGAPRLMTQADLAQLLVKKLGLLNVVGKATPSPIECIDVLTRYNIVPAMTLNPEAGAPQQGWNLDPAATVERNDLIILLVRALGLTDQVAQNGDVSNIDSWEKVLKDVQIPITTPRAGVAQLVPLNEVIAAIPVRASTPEPLTKLYIPSSEGLGLIDAVATGGTVKFMDLSGGPMIGTEPPVPPPPPTPGIRHRPPPKEPVTPNTSKANSEI